MAQQLAEQEVPKFFEYDHVRIFKKQEKNPDDYTDTDKAIVTFIQGNKGCLPAGEFVYTKDGIIPVEQVKNGTKIIGGKIEGLYSFEDEVYEITIGSIKFKANGNHPLWISKNNAAPQWVDVKEIHDHLNGGEPSFPSNWFAKFYNAKELDVAIETTMPEFRDLMDRCNSESPFTECCKLQNKLWRMGFDSIVKPKGGGFTVVVDVENKPSEWQIISSAKKIGKQKVFGWNTNPTKQIVSYNGLKTHNSGKSGLLERIGERHKLAGHTVIDLLAVDNYENLYQMINNNCKEYYADWKNDNPDDNDPPPCMCDTRYPILAIIPDYVEVKEENRAIANGKLIVLRSKQEVIKYGLNEWRPNADGVMIVENPRWDGKEWIKFKKLPIPTKGFKNRDSFIAKLTEILFIGRDEGRYICLNPVFFSDKNHKFRLLEQILREIGVIVRSNFKPITPDEAGRLRGTNIPVPYEDMTQQERNRHRVTILMRELGSVAPAGLKGEPLETLVKKAILNVIRIVRHYRMSLICDFQRHADVIPSIRDQRDYFIWKQTNVDMFPEDYKWLKDEIKKKREELIASFDDGRGERMANLHYPDIENLKKDEAYVLYPTKNKFGRRWKKLRIRTAHFHHHQEDDDYEQQTSLGFGTGWFFTTKGEDGKLVETVVQQNAEDKDVLDATKSRVFSLVTAWTDPSLPSDKRLNLDKSFEKLKEMGLADTWKNPAALRKFMSVRKKKLTKGNNKSSSEENEDSSE